MAERPKAMRVSRFLVGLWLAVLAVAVPSTSSAQELVLGPQFEERFEELSQWVKQYYAWKCPTRWRL